MSDEIRCFMCSKMNPAGQEECSYCGARLMPLHLTPPPPADEPEPDWLRSLSGQPEEPASAKPGTPAEDGDWLSRIRQLGQDEDQTESAPADDWLSALRGPASAAESVDEPEDDPALDSGSGLDRLDDLRADGGSSPNEVSDWLAQLDSAAESARQTPEPAAEAPDWLAGFSSSPAAPVEPKAEQPPEQDWLAGMSAASTAAPAEDLPDWLSSSSPAAPVEPKAEQPPEQDWLAGMSAASTAAPAEDLPDWLSSSSPAAPAEPKTEQPPEQDWLAGMSAASTAAPAEGLPDWLSSSSPAAPVEPKAEQPPEQEWLADSFQELNVTPEPPVEAPASAPADDREHDWLDTFLNLEPPVAETPTGEAGEESLFSAELPAWLGSTETAKPPTEAQPPTSAGDSLATANLPAWVEAMRPIETATGATRAEEDNRVENAGPLAGLRGILPGEAAAIAFRKPPVYSARLHLTEKQRAQSTLLEEMLAQETRPQPMATERALAPQGILRVAAALALIVAVLVPLLTGFQLSGAPQVFPRDTASLFESVETLPPGAAVLVAVDYEPGLAGEMQLAAVGVMDHLMLRGARLTTVSTSPTGPVLAGQLVELAARNHPGYALDAQVVNLGYLAGGTTSLLEFALRPKFAAPFTFSGENAWEQPALSGVNELKDFGLVVVLTDNAETGRAWVEQVQPLLNSAPLVMVSSAQSAPLLAPYFQSGQLQGLLGGLSGGMIYGQLTHRPALNPLYWSAYQVGILVMVALMVLGLLAAIVTGNPARSGRGKRSSQNERGA